MRDRCAMLAAQALAKRQGEEKDFLYLVHYLPSSGAKALAKAPSRLTGYAFF